MQRQTNTSDADPSSLHDILGWCASAVGECEVLTTDGSVHDRTAVHRLRTPSAVCYYVKMHRRRSFWETEVHAYEQWAPAFGSLVPRLIAVREEEPLALLLSELPGRSMQTLPLDEHQERMVWRAAGRALTGLHQLALGKHFGPCQRDGAPIGTPISDASAYISAELERETLRGVRAGYLDDDELAVIHAARPLLAAFAGERPVPCHRDYGPVNWLVSDDRAWAGTMDFEFAHWDVRVADFSRYPDWEWMSRPELLDAFFDGYGRPLTVEEEKQCLVARVLYALGAITWGREHSNHGFESEGRQALRHLAESLA